MVANIYRRKTDNICNICSVSDREISIAAPISASELNVHQMLRDRLTQANVPDVG